jgi:23S rRNA pseudouridine955/2504/2580 synthase
VLLARLEAGSLVLAEPLTGRTHQIRAHAWYMGYPIVGDKLYGASDQSFLEFTHQHERNNSPRQLLHASRIRFPHPASGVAMDIRSPAIGLVCRGE